VQDLQSDVDPKLAEEARYLHALLNQMPELVEAGSKWFFISTSWLNKWKRYVHFHKVSG
jgi:hypothetical protein